MATEGTKELSVWDFTFSLALSLRERGFPYAPFLTFPLRGKGLNG